MRSLRYTLCLSLEVAAVFVRTIDLALQRAEASYSRETWQTMTPSERSAAIYRALRTLDTELITERTRVPLPRPRRRKPFP